MDVTVNYIVSGLERSGTSMMMQIIRAGGAPIASDKSRPPDESNPKGYYELEGGKIINKLADGTFPIDQYKGQFIKITAYGIKFLPPGKYKIIYSERNLEEILDSMEKMAKIKDENRNETREVFYKLNEMIKQKILEREDIEVLFLNYNDILSNPTSNIEKIHDFLSESKLDLEQMLGVVDKRLYRQRRTTPG